MIIFSDGAGRSGVYIANDANIKRCEEDGVLQKMRGLRHGLVETQVSYKLNCKLPELA